MQSKGFGQVHLDGIDWSKGIDQKAGQVHLKGSKVAARKPSGPWSGKTFKNCTSDSTR
jgi:hypothetical protein